MSKKNIIPEVAARRLRWPLFATHFGMVSEQIVRAFWPLATVVLVVLAALLFGLHEHLSIDMVWGLGVLSIAAFLIALVWGARQFQWPDRDAALGRLDDSLPGHPITALTDDQAIGANDAASRAVWDAHVARMAQRLDHVAPVQPDLRVARRDPYALRYVALLAFVMAVLFGSFLRLGSVPGVATGGGDAIASGPSWEAWIEPPAYTGRPALYLADIDRPSLSVPAGSRFIGRLYGAPGKLRIDETVSGRIGELPPATDPAQEFMITQSGRLEIVGPGGASYDIEVVADDVPQIAPSGDLTKSLDGEMQQPFAVLDDYAVVSGRAEIVLDLDAIERRYGYAIDPDSRDPIALDLPLTISGNRADFSETLVENLKEHPWAGLPVRMTLFAQDATGQTGSSAPITFDLPGRRFFDPLANALIEERRELLWSRENSPRVSQVLRAIAYRADDVFPSHTLYLVLRVATRRLETSSAFAPLTVAGQEEVAGVLWDIATQIEDGKLSDALERLRRAQDRLSEAMRQGASDEEIQELMDELREATNDYMRQLAQEALKEDGTDQAQNPDMETIDGNQIQEMMDQIQELMEQGRMAEAQQMLDELRRMMENMQMTQGANGQQSPGQQAMEGLAETLRNQQGLNDETFSDLQNQFGEQGQQGQEGQQGEQGQEGQQGQQGGNGQQGQQGETGPGGAQPGQQGERRPGDQPGQDGREGSGGQNSGEGLAERQQALRDELERQRQGLPGAGTPGGDAARDALDRAGRAMDRAEGALRDRDYAEALDNQSEAMEALREGIRELGEQLAQEQSQQDGQQGQANGQAAGNANRDPLGRRPGSSGQFGTDDPMLQGDDVYRRAREILDEIRRRAAEQERPDSELEYLKRLLERF